MFYPAGRLQGVEYFRIFVRHCNRLLKRVMKIVFYLLMALTFVLSTACADSRQQESAGTLTVQGTRLADNEGRTVILNGINHVVKSPEQSYVYEGDEELFARFREWGINCVRYGIHWDGLEPEPGRIDENYLKELDKRVYWARRNNLMLILDMHQDLYSRKFGNGAPLWATLDDGAEHVTGTVWSDAYLMSPAVQRSFDSFWQNRPASDGVGLQDHYASVWKVLARRYADSVSVVGFDVMNEPFIGSRAQAVVGRLVAGCAEHLPTDMAQPVSEADFMRLWLDEDQRKGLLKLLDNQTVFSSILARAEGEVRSFEENELSDFYQKVRDAIRSTSSRQILFLEHNYFCNMGMESTFRIPLAEDGRPDSLCAYAPHAYDLVVDTQAATEPGYERIDYIFGRIAASAARRGMPVLVGEWGAFYNGGQHYRKPALHQMKHIARLFSGHTYWAWWPGIESQDYFSVVISRPYPQCVNGTLISYTSPAEGEPFVCRWKEGKSSACTRIYLPDVTQVEGKIRLEPDTDFRVIRIAGDTRAGYLEVEPCGVERRLYVE